MIGADATVVRPVVRGLAAAVVACACGGALVHAQAETIPSGGGIARLNAATRQEAVECGNAGAACAVHPYELCADQSERYSVRLVTPFSRVAAAALEARNNRQPLGRMGPGAVNQWGVALIVSPAQGSVRAGAIGRVEIRRDDGTVIHPRWTTVTPITTRVGDGATRRLARGFFVFPDDTFSPASDLKVIFVGDAGESICALDREHLSALR